MFYLVLSLFSLGIVILDQISKYLTVLHIPEGGIVHIWDQVVHLTYVKNDGAAFSILSGHRWLFVVIALLAIGFAVLLIWKKIFTERAELWCIAAILGGAVGNLIDRVAYGYVVDMIEVEFTRFAVFNVADCFITCGTAFLCYYELKRNQEKKRLAAQEKEAALLAAAEQADEKQENEEPETRGGEAE